MDKQDILTMYVKFQERCKHIANILSKYDRDFNASKLNDWQLEYDQNKNPTNCIKDVDIYVMGCYVDSCTLSFPVELLSATDEQIHEYASNKYKKI
jgi:hypothetical protein